MPGIYSNTAVDPATGGEGGWSGLIGAGLTGLAGYLGNQSATNNLTGAEQGAIGTQTGIQNQLTGIYGNQRALGNSSDNTLAAQLGLNGTPDYAPFYNSPGYQFAIQQGDQAIQRQASAKGDLYTPQTMAMLSQYNTGYASQNYNNYINQLMQSAGLGAQGNAGLGQGIYQTGANISQLQQNQGNARAGGATTNAGIASNLLSKVPWGQVGNAVSGWFSGSPSNPQDGAGFVQDGSVYGGDYSPYVSLPGTSVNDSGVDPSTGMPTNSDGSINWGFGGDGSTGNF